MGVLVETRLEISLLFRATGFSCKTIMGGDDLPRSASFLLQVPSSMANTATQ
jgi:hypothetical protein